jgi:hypothetical protein
MNFNDFLTWFHKIVFCSPARSLNIIGLLLNIFGVMMIYLYGLPEEISRSGHIYWVTGGEDRQEKEKAKRYDRWARLGLISLFLGFIIQLLSNFY